MLVRIHPNLPDGPRPGGPDLVHVDAYRLGSASEIDDIDLENTMDSAVTVVEWGRGRVEHLSESRLEVDLVRSLGGAQAPAHSPESGHGPAPTEHAEVLDFDTDDDDEPRTIVIRGFGPRWAAPPALPAPRPRRPARAGGPHPHPRPCPTPRKGPDADPCHRHLGGGQRRAGLR